MSNKLTKLDVLREMHYRGLIKKGSKEDRDYHWLTKGLEGELDMLQRLKDKIKDRARVLHDVSIDCNGWTQIDLLVLWDKLWWVIEVKNYWGIFRVEGDKNYLNDQPLRKNYLMDMSNRIRIVEELASSIDKQIQVQGSFILINEDGDLQIDQKPAFPILTRNQINLHIDPIILNQPAASPKLIKYYLHQIQQYHKSFPDDLPQINPQALNDCQKGVRCPHCQTYFTQKSDRRLHCNSCQRDSYKHDLVLDLYKQYCTLNYAKENITIRELFDFSEKYIGTDTIRQTIKNHAIYRYRSNRSYISNVHQY